MPEEEGKIDVVTRGFGYNAFVVDAYAGVITGWECSLTKDTGFVERALRHGGFLIGSTRAIRSMTQSIVEMPEVIIPQYITARR